RVAAPCAEQQAGLVHPRQQRRAQLLDMGGHPGDGACRPSRSGAPFLHGCRRHAEPGRPAARRTDPAGAAQQSPAIRHYLVRLGRGARGHLHHLHPPAPGGERSRRVNLTPYKTLEARFARLGALQDATAMLQWDSATLMPAGGAAARSEQLATLKVVCHETLTDPSTADLLDGAEAQNDLDQWQRANLAEMRWREARPAGDFALVLPELRRVLGLVREAAAAKAERLGKSPYEALLDE